MDQSQVSVFAAAASVGTSALVTGLVQALKSYGLAPNQRWVFVWSLALAVGVQVAYAIATLPAGASVTVPLVAAAALLGLNSALAAGGLHDHGTAVIAAVKGTGDGGTPPASETTSIPMLSHPVAPAPSVPVFTTTDATTTSWAPLTPDLQAVFAEANAIYRQYKQDGDAEKARAAVAAWRQRHPDVADTVPEGWPV